MIILPEEERKSSPLMTWTFRLLMVCVVVVCMILFALKMLSGTSESHRRGLEQALSDAFHSQVKIGTLKTFNLVPHFLIEMENIEGIHEHGRFSLESARLAFGLGDILLHKGHFGNVDIKNLAITEGLAGGQDLLVETVEIFPPDAGKKPRLHLKGLYGVVPFSIDLALETNDNSQTSFRLGRQNELQVVSGRFRLSGQYQRLPGKPWIDQGKLTLDGAEIAHLSISPSEDKEDGLKVSFTVGGSNGNVKLRLQQTETDWHFEMLDLIDVIGDRAALAQIAAVWQELSAKNQPSPARITFSIDNVRGDVSGSNVRGVFVRGENGYTGWWTGELTHLPPQTDQLAPGRIACALVQSPPGRPFDIKKMAIVMDDSVSAQAYLALATPPSSADSRFVFGVNRIEAGSSVFGLSPEPFMSLADPLSLKDDSACLDLLKETGRQ